MERGIGMKTGIDKTRCIQIGILVHNVEEASKEWAKFFGVEVPEVKVTDGYDETQATYKGEPCQGILRQAFFNFDNIQIELIQPADEQPSIWRDCLDRDGEGVHHISFGAKNTAGFLANCKAKGYDTLQTGEFYHGRYAYLDSFQKMKVIIETLEMDDADLSVSE